MNESPDPKVALASVIPIASVSDPAKRTTLAPRREPGVPASVAAGVPASVRIVPDNKAPVLWCEGGCKRPTLHFFRESRRDVNPSNPSGSSLGTRLFFACSECSRERSWGFIS